MKVLKALLANSGAVSKFLVAATGVVLTGLVTHNWTGTSNVIMDGVAVLVYLIPNVNTKPAG
jgi:hypothetical protein